MPVLLKHFEEAKAARRYHRARGRVGNVEAMVAGLKVMWLAGIIRELDPAAKISTRD